MSGPQRYDVYWGDFHKHATGFGTDVADAQDQIDDARYNIDVYPVLCYPFEWYRKGKDTGIRDETVGNQPKFFDWWETVQAVAAENNDPGEFVTFPAYEWHGDRTRWGDHNVIFREDGDLPLDDARDLADLYDDLRDLAVDAFALPHHTAYQVGNRGKDWSAFDPELSPVMEVYSRRGSSEGVGTPVPMDENPSMGPRTSGGTLIDGLNSGHRMGVLASNDGPGLPGTWNQGVAGIWAEELTRDAVWEALEARRTYASTGDRIRLWYEVDGEPMGSELSADEPVSATAEVDCPRPLDRVELIHDGRVADTYCHQGSWEWPGPEGTAEYRILVELGWGPKPDYGDWTDTRMDWTGEARVEGGELTDVMPRFVGHGQRYHHDGDRCTFELTTERESDDLADRQAFVFTVEGDGDTDLVVDVEGHDSIERSLVEAREARVVGFVDESYDRIEREFDLGRDDVGNSDTAYHNARKVKLHPAYPEAACRATAEFADLEPSGYYYVRASQVDRQHAWSSPIWLD